MINLFPKDVYEDVYEATWFLPDLLDSILCKNKQQETKKQTIYLMPTVVCVC